MIADTTKWSGEGTFTQVVVDWLQGHPAVAAIRVEDAPASRSEADYNFISNEIFIVFTTEQVSEPVRRLGIFPGVRTVERKAHTMEDLERALTAAEGIGAPDYSDQAMVQYLRTERIIPPYQTRGYKLVELVRIYEAIAAPPSGRH
jgi:hypothetical protein